MHISLDSALGRQRRLNSVGESFLQIAPSAAAAYSLRSLTSGDPKVVRVRRASDNHEQDFTASGVSSGALVNFVNAQVTAPLDIQALSATGRDGDFLIAKAAYSLRSLGTRQATLAATGDTEARADGKFVCQVRRSSDDALKSFTADEVTDGTLLAFTNADYDKYTSDFSAGTNSWGDSLDDLTAAGNIDGIGGLDDNLRLTIGSATSQHRAFRTGILPINQKINFSARVFIPSSNSVVDSFRMADASGTPIIASTTPAQDQWVTVTASDVTPTNSSGQLRLFLQDGGVSSFAGNGSDVIYLREVTVTQVTSDGLVKTWYDQSVTTQAGDTATGNHATQATAASQPKIVEAGSLLADGLTFDGSDDKLDIPNDLIASINSASSFLVAKSNTLSSSRIALALSHSTSNFRFYSGALLSAKFHFGYQNTALKIELSSADTNKHLFTSIAGSSNAEGFLDGTSKGTASSVDGKSTLSSGGIGAINTGNFWSGTIEEVVVYDTDQTDNRTAIEANIGEAYSITGIPAYDNTVDGFVETWYDQSGNSNDAVQATAGSQPKIVSAGSFLNELDFDGTDDNFELTSVLGITSAAAIFTVAESGGGDDKLILDNRDGGVDGFRLLRLTNDLEYRWQSATVDTGTNLGTNTKFLGFANHDGSDAFAAVNGAGLTAVSDTSSMSVAAKPHIGARSFSTASNFWDGTMNELIIYNFDQNDNRLAIETNINNHYSIF